MASKFEQYLEILNNKQPKRNSASVAQQAEESSPLRTKQYLKTVTGESEARNSSTMKVPEEEGGAQSHRRDSYDFTKAELPFSNFASVQEQRERDRHADMAATTTIATSNAGDARNGMGSIAEYYKKQGQRQEANMQSGLQYQIDSLQTTINHLMEKHDSLDYRLNFCESNVTAQMDRNRERHNHSTGSQETSQLRLHQRQAQAHHESVQKETEAKLNQQNRMTDDMNNLQVQMDRLDCKLREIREEQMRQSVDPKPFILEQIDSVLQHIDLKYAKKSALTASIDNLGEEIASDINGFENQLRIESERIQNMSEAVENQSNDLKICQISIAKIPLPIDSNSETQHFSETLVKQLLRQGEDRKTSVEETKMLQSKIQEVKLTQKRQREQQLKLQKQIRAFDEEVCRNSHNLEKVMAHQLKITTVQTSLKFNKNEFVNKDDLHHIKERCNAAFQSLLKLHESTIERDSYLVDTLLETQKGKLNRLIVKKHTHDNLKIFQEELNDPFEPPEILLSLKPESAWRQHGNGKNTQKLGGSRGRGHTRSNSLRQTRSRSRSTNGSRSKGGTVRLSNRGGSNGHGHHLNMVTYTHSQHKKPRNHTVKQANKSYNIEAYNEQRSENDYYAEDEEHQTLDPTISYDEIDRITDEENQDLATSTEGIPMPPPRHKRSRSKRRQYRQQVDSRQSQRHRQGSKYNYNTGQISQSSKRSISQRSQQSRKSTKSDRVRKDYNRGERQHRQSRDGRSRQHHKRIKKQTGQASQISSNKDLPSASESKSTRNHQQQQYPMFGYQVKSSETAGIGDIYDTTKGGDGRTHGQIKSGYDKHRTSNKKEVADRNNGKDQHHFIPMASNFAQEQPATASHDQIIQQEEASKQSAQSKKNSSYNYENSINMWANPSQKSQK